MVSLRFASAIAALSTFSGVVNAATTLPVPNPANGDVNGEYCGPSFENKKCSAGWCCSVDGICGKGGYYCSGPDCQFKFADACDANQKPGGADTADTPRTKFGSVPYGVTLTTCTKPGVVALTFDDGPYLYTNQLLDYLSSQKVNVTFFMTANNGGKGDIGQPSSPYYATVKRAFDDGHQIASHTYSHQDLSLIGADYRKKQVQYNEIVFNSILGMIPTYIRPPYLSCDADCLKDLGDWGYHVLSIDLDTNDWQLNYPQAKKDFLELGVNYSPCEKSWNTLAHDIHQQTVTDLVPFMIENLHARGYRTALIGECLGDAPENWYRHPTTGAPAGPSRNLPAYVAPTNCTAVVAPEPECGPIGPKSTNGQCGAAAGGAICNNGECCSQWGWCGATTDNCDAGCQVAFGACNGIAPICRNNTSASASLSATRAPSATVSSFASASVSVSRLSSASGSASRVSSAVSSAASGSASRASSAASGSASRVSSASAGSSAAASGSASRGSSAAASGSAAPSGSVSRGSSAAPSGSASRGSSAAASASGRPSGSSGAASASARPSGSSAAASASGRPSGSSVRPSGASVRPSGSSVAASARPSGSSAAGSASARPSGSSARASSSAAPSGSSVRPSSIRASSVRASASPSASAGAISKDGTCGPSHGNTSCPNGQCCSQYGWCGVSTAFCGTGCLSKFGVCSGGRDTQNEWTDPSKLKESQDGVCGGASGLKCPTGQCCSQYGWCGRGSDFCRSGCQRAFGQCS